MIRDPKDRETLAQQFALFGIVSGIFLATMGAGLGVGYLLWKKAGFPWWVLIVTGFLGIALATYEVVIYQRRL